MLLRTESARNGYVDCPFAGLDALAALAKGEKYSDFSMHCKADACMCWRWSEEVSKSKKYEGEPLGYCGLAGKPEEEI